MASDKKALAPAPPEDEAPTNQAPALEPEPEVPTVVAGPPPENLPNPRPWTEAELTRRDPVTEQWAPLLIEDWPADERKAYEAAQKAAQEVNGDA